MSKENENKKAEAVVDGTNVQVNAEVKDAVKPEETKTAEKPAEKKDPWYKKAGRGALTAGKWLWRGAVTVGAVVGTYTGVRNAMSIKGMKAPVSPTVPGSDPAGNAAIGTGTNPGISTGVGTDTVSNTFTGTDVF